jgi:hypothetical protein
MHHQLAPGWLKCAFSASSGSKVHSTSQDVLGDCALALGQLEAVAEPVPAIVRVDHHALDDFQIRHRWPRRVARARADGAVGAPTMRSSSNAASTWPPCPPVKTACCAPG